MNLDFLKPLLATTNFEVVEYASQMDFVGNSTETRTLPAVFFHLFKEEAQPNETLGAVSQVVKVMIAFKVVTKNIDLDAARTDLNQKLMGFTPTSIECLSAFEYIGGEVVDVDKSTIWWRDIYQINILKRSL